MSDFFNCKDVADCRARLADYLVQDEYVLPKNLDVDGDGEVCFEEAAAYVLKRPDWERYLDVYDRIGLKHPLDYRNFSEPVRRRIAELDEAINSRLGMDSGSSNYCDEFVSRFVSAGTASFRKGGLCFSYPIELKRSWMQIFQEPEQTAEEAFSSCLDSRNGPFGSCSEMTHRVGAAVAATGRGCPVDAILTERHVFPRSGDIDLDPSNIGKIGWEREVSAATVYYESLGIEGDPIASKIAAYMEPDHIVDIDEARRFFNEGRFEEALGLFVRVVESNNLTVTPFMHMLSLTTSCTPLEKLDFGIAVIKRWPDNPHAYFPLVNALTSGSQVDEAVGVLLTELPFSGWAETEEAIWAAKNHDMVAAVEKALAALRHNPRNAFALSIIAQDDLSHGNLAAAEGLIRGSIAIAPNLVGNHFMLSHIAQMNGDWDTALEESKAEAVVWPGNPTAYMLMTQMQLVTGKPRQAMDGSLRMIQAWERMPNSEQMLFGAYLLLMNSLLLMGDAQGARRAFMGAFSMVPGSPFLSQNAAMLELFDLNVDDARRHLSKIGPLNDHIHTSQLNLRLYLYENDVEAVEREIGVLEAKLGKDHYMVDMCWGYLHMMRGEYDSARASFKRAAEKNKHDIGSRLGEVQVDVFEGKTQDAWDKVKKLAEKYPDVFSIVETMPLVALRDGEYEWALALSAKILEIHDRSYAGLIVAGLSLVEVGSYRLALECGKKLQDLLPRQPDGWLISARAKFKMGEYEEARALALKAKELTHFDSKSWPLMSSSALLSEIDAAMAAGK